MFLLKQESSIIKFVNVFLFNSKFTLTNHLIQKGGIIWELIYNYSDIMDISARRGLKKP